MSGRRYHAKRAPAGGRKFARHREEVNAASKALEAREEEGDRFKGFRVHSMTDLGRMILGGGASGDSAVDRLKP